MDKERIKAFAQNTLGCGCPEEVFQHIECKTNAYLEKRNHMRKGWWAEEDNAADHP